MAFIGIYSPYSYWLYSCLARITGKYGLSQDHIPWRMNGSDIGILPPNLTDPLLTTRAEKHKSIPKRGLRRWWNDAQPTVRAGNALNREDFDCEIGWHMSSKSASA